MKVPLAANLMLDAPCSVFLPAAVSLSSILPRRPLKEAVLPRAGQFVLGRDGVAFGDEVQRDGQSCR